MASFCWFYCLTVAHIFVTIYPPKVFTLRLNEYSRDFVEVVWSPHLEDVNFIHCFFQPVTYAYTHSYTKQLPRNCTNVSNRYARHLHIKSDLKIEMNLRGVGEAPFLKTNMKIGLFFLSPHLQVFISKHTVHVVRLLQNLSCRLIRP